MIDSNSKNDWRVSVVQESLYDDVKNSKDRLMETAQLPDLSSSNKHDTKEFLLINSTAHKKKSTTAIAEIQSIPSDFSAFFVGRHVVGDGNLYVMNRVDPMFFVLAKFPACEETKQSWQPLEQVIATLPDPVRQGVPQDQLKHFFQTMCSEQTDNVTYYKFAVRKALRWLQRKQDATHAALFNTEKSRLLKSQQKGEQTKSTRGGSVSATFYVPEDEEQTAGTSSQSPTKSAVPEPNSETIKAESLQVLCNYLNPEWTEQLLKHLSLSMDLITEPKKKAPMVNRTIKASTTVEETKSEPKKQAVKLVAPRSMTNKKLDKVNKKGMKSLSSFFGAAPKAKKAKVQ